MKLSIPSNGVRLMADVEGIGPEAVLLHAGGERRQVWRPVMASLAAAGFTSIALDQRGHGDSQGSANDSIFAFASDVHNVLEARGGCPVVVGASLGGLAAMLALSDPGWLERTAGLVLVDVVPDPDPDRVRAFLSQTTQRLDRYVPIIEEILGQPDTFRAAAKRLMLPVMFVHAENSPISLAEVERLRLAIPHLAIATINESGHLVARDAPAKLSQLIGDFLSSDSVRDRRIERCITLARGDSLAHPGGTLGAHLRRVGDTLRRWGEDATVVDAGRLHAVYGAQGFAPPNFSPARPEQLRLFVSAATERLIALYGRCERPVSYPSWDEAQPIVVSREDGEVVGLSDMERAALIAMTVANEMDVLNHDRELARAHRRAFERLFARWRPWLKRAAQAELDGWLSAAASQSSA